MKSYACSTIIVSLLILCVGIAQSNLGPVAPPMPPVDSMWDRLDIIDLGILSPYCCGVEFVEGEWFVSHGGESPSSNTDNIIEFQIVNQLLMLRVDAPLEQHLNIPPHMGRRRQPGIQRAKKRIRYSEFPIERARVHNAELGRCVRGRNLIVRWVKTVGQDAALGQGVFLEDTSIP